MGKQTLKKGERLSGEKTIKELFEKGSSFYLSPFKVVSLPQPEEKENRVLISIPIRNFKRSVDRNKLKRRIYSWYTFYKR